MKLSAAPLPLRPAVKTPGVSIETPSFASAASAPETVTILPPESQRLSALPAAPVLPVTTGAPETLREPSAQNTPPPPNLASLPVMLPPCRRKLPPRTYTPPPMLLAVLPVMLPPCRRKLPLSTNTPPPTFEASLPVTLPPVMVKLPLSTSTPPPLPCTSLPVTLPPFKVKLPPETYTPPLSLFPPVILPLPAGSAAVALESVTVRLPLSHIQKTQPSVAAASRPLSIVKPFRSSATVLPEGTTSASLA